jgi:hypothetical protein
MDDERLFPDNHTYISTTYILPLFDNFTVKVMINDQSRLVVMEYVAT